jgi:hypothetical protein
MNLNCRSTSCAAPSAPTGRLFSRVLLLLVLPAFLQAQGTIAGIVRDSAGRPLSDADVHIASLDRRVRTDSSGNFVIGALAAGTYQLRVRRLGFYAMNTNVVLRDGATKRIIISLPSRPIMLDTIRIAAECARWDFAGFVCRRRNASATGKGVFFDTYEIDSASPRFPIDMLREVPGVKVVAKRQGKGLGLESEHDWMCKFVELANGKPPSLSNPLPAWPNETLGIEVYATAADVPKEYSNFIGGRWKNTCGLVNYWTVVRPRKKTGTVRDTSPA